jgi:hypothetical protein
LNVCEALIRKELAPSVVNVVVDGEQDFVNIVVRKLWLQQSQPFKDLMLSEESSLAVSNPKGISLIVELQTVSDLLIGWNLGGPKLCAGYVVLIDHEKLLETPIAADKEGVV